MTTTTVNLPVLMSTAELAKYLGTTRGSILAQRNRKDGHPLYSKGFLVGNQLRFYAEDVLEYVSSLSEGVR